MREFSDGGAIVNEDGGDGKEFGIRRDGSATVVVVPIQLEEVARDTKLGDAEGGDSSTAQLPAGGESAPDRTDEIIGRARHRCTARESATF